MPTTTSPNATYLGLFDGEVRAVVLRVIAAGERLISAQAAGYDDNKVDGVSVPSLMAMGYIVGAHAWLRLLAVSPDDQSKRDFTAVHMAHLLPRAAQHSAVVERPVGAIPKVEALCG